MAKGEQKGNREAKKPKKPKGRGMATGFRVRQEEIATQAST